MKRSGIFVLVIVLAAMGVLGFAHRTKAPSDTSTAVTQSTNTISYQGEDAKNALDLLKSHATVETTTDPSLGEYVTSVNGVKGGTNNKYWIMYVNGQSSSVGASDYVTKSTDTIEWKFE